MNWITLSPFEVAAAWTALAAIALWMYLHHRRPQHRRVSTLRFWSSVQPISQPRRRRLREPWALLAQVLFLLFLILALADVRWGSMFEGRSVVIVFDTSTWSQAHPAGAAPAIDQEREEAQRLLNSLPEGDRVLLVRAETDAPPILPFTTDRVALRRAIANAQPSGDIEDVPDALENGREALAGSSHGLLVYVGPGMLDEDQGRRLDEFRASVEEGGRLQFLVRVVGDDALTQNRGITHLSLRRDAAQPDRWHLLTQLRNYSDTKANVVLKLSISDQPIGQRAIALAPNELANAEDEFTWDKGGLLQAEIGPSDSLEADDRAVVDLPMFRTVQVGVFTEGSSPFIADLLPVLSGNPYVRAQIVPPGNPFKLSPDVAIYQGAHAPSQSDFNSIWFLSGPPTPDARSVRVVDWNSQHPVTRWVRTHDVSVRNPSVLQVQPGDSVLAYSEGDPPAPLILAREQNGHRLLIIGFDPHESNFPQESAFPLLMAGGIEWMTRSVDEVAESVSTGELDLPEPVTRIVGPSGKDVPFARIGADVHLLALQTGIYRVISQSGEKSIVVNTPPLPMRRLTVAPTESAEVDREIFRPEGSHLWRWLLLLGIVALWLEWWLYYSSRERQRTSEIRIAPGDGSLQSVNRELEAQEESESRKPNFVV